VARPYSFATVHIILHKPYIKQRTSLAAVRVDHSTRYAHKYTEGRQTTATAQNQSAHVGTQAHNTQLRPPRHLHFMNCTTSAHTTDACSTDCTPLPSASATAVLTLRAHRAHTPQPNAPKVPSPTDTDQPLPATQGFLLPKHEAALPAKCSCSDSHMQHPLTSPSVCTKGISLQKHMFKNCKVAAAKHQHQLRFPEFWSPTHTCSTALSTECSNARLDSKHSDTHK
jgi:hypothetical protein